MGNNKPPARFQHAAAAVLGNTNYNAKPAVANITSDRYGGGVLPPSGYRGGSLSYPRGGTGGAVREDPFTYNQHYNVPAPKIATINVRVS